MKKLFIGLICVFALSLIPVLNTHAVSDITLTSSTANPCGNSVNCYEAGYRYIILSSSYTTITSSYETSWRIAYQCGGASYTVSLGISPTIIYEILPSCSLSNVVFVANENVSAVITDSLPGSSEPSEPCPEPEPQEPCPDPEENSRFIQVVLDAFWKYHMVFAGAVASLIAIFVVYRIIKGLLR